MAEKRLRALVRGRVQGVGFRYFVREVAHPLGVMGYVRNLAGGPVEVVAEGDERSLLRLAEALRRGPIGARIDHVDLNWSEPRNEFSSFRIEFTSY